MEELEEEIFVESEGDLALAHLVNHHEWNAILLNLATMVDKVHVDDVVLDDNVLTIFERWQVPAAPRPDLNIAVALYYVIVMLFAFIFLVLQAEA